MKAIRVAFMRLFNLTERELELFIDPGDEIDAHQEVVEKIVSQLR